MDVMKDVRTKFKTVCIIKRMVLVLVVMLADTLATAGMVMAVVVVVCCVCCGCLQKTLQAMQKKVCNIARQYQHSGQWTGVGSICMYLLPVSLAKYVGNASGTNIWSKRWLLECIHIRAAQAKVGSYTVNSVLKVIACINIQKWRGRK